MGKGSAPTETKQTVTQTNLPEYVRPYFERLLGRTEAESKREYEPYGGQRIADTSQDLLTSEDMVRDIAGAGLPGLDAAMGRVGQSLDYTPRQFTGEEVDQYMSPYMDAVVARQKAGATEDYLASMPQGAAQAISAGAFGGSRQGVQKGIAQSKYLDRLADIEATGRQKAFDQAASAFQADRAADFQAEQLGLGAAGQLANLSERARAGDVDAARMLEQIGKAQMGRDQASLDMGYQDFLRQQAYPAEKLGLFSSVLRGIPVTPSQTTSTRMPYDPFGRAIGLGLTALGGAKYFG
tara:strand:+ start:1569 stop:2453 length:885 start_codon:yes stop_codon:yes gene_type:complete